MSRPAEAVISNTALQHNLQRVRELAPEVQVMAVVKANGYGHNLLRVARSLSEADAFGVASLEEGWALRRAGVNKPITLLEGFFDESELPDIVDNDFDIVIHHIWQVNQLAHAKLAKPLKVWLKLDTGMHRLGLEDESLMEATEHLLKSGNIQAGPGLMSHLANADDSADQTTREQLARMEAAGWSGPKSMANSAGVIGWPDSHYDWVRPGIMLYGVSPMLGQTGLQHDLKPAMTLRSRLIAVKHLKKGDKVGYGGTFECPEDMPIGVVAMGYGDGYPRHAPNGTPVRIGDKVVKMAGRVSMDMLTVDLRGHPHARVGEEVTLWGEGLPIEVIAEQCGTIGYELVCGVTSRVKQVQV
jgi:alanine racemase